MVKFLFRIWKNRLESFLFEIFLHRQRCNQNIHNIKILLTMTITIIKKHWSLHNLLSLIHSTKETSLLYLQKSLLSSSSSSSRLFSSLSNSNCCKNNRNFLTTDNRIAKKMLEYTPSTITTTASLIIDLHQYNHLSNQW